MAESKNYRELNDELAAIIEKLQSSDLDVDQIIVEYQRGTAVIAELEKYLNSAQNKIIKLTAKNPKSKK